MEDPDKILKDLYYGQAGFMNKQTLHKLAIKKDPGITLNYIKHWLRTQNIHQIFQKQNANNRYDMFAHFYVTKPNSLHMMDLMSMPNDKSSHFILCVIDSATRFKAARHLANKTASNVADKIKEIYRESQYLKYPELMHCDAGSEFKGVTKQLFEEHGVDVRVGNTGMHRHNCYVEVMNRDLAKRLFLHMSRKELETNKVSKEWVRYLQPTINAMNNEVHSSIHMTPTEAMQLGNVEQKKFKVNDGPHLDIGSTVRYLLNNDEIQDTGQQDKTVFKSRRSTDPKYSLKKYLIKSSFDTPDNPRLYKLYGIDNRWFTSACLKEVSPDP